MFPGMEEEADDISLVNVASPGVGAAANSFLSLVNLEDDEFEIDRVLDSNNPGVGASTPYFGRSFRASEPIAPGTELYVRYVSGCICK